MFYGSTHVKTGYQAHSNISLPFKFITAKEVTDMCYVHRLSKIPEMNVTINKILFILFFPFYFMNK